MHTHTLITDVANHSYTVLNWGSTTSTAVFTSYYCLL